jgi:biopolymer transport protein ExbB
MHISEYIEKCGPIMEILVVLNIIGFSIMIWKFVQLLYARKTKQKILNALIKVIEEKEVPLHDEHIVKELIKDELSYKINKLEVGLSSIRIIASIAPLLGLLGTVIGVEMAFEAISKMGMGDPSIFAKGISIALITTIGGLIVAIPHYVGYNYLIAMLDKIEIELEKDILPAIYHNKKLISKEKSIS